MIPETAFIKARHITITAELVQVVGGMNEAAVASLIQWKTEPGAPHATADGWWEATAEFLADWIGLSVPQIRRALKKLIDDGHIESAELRRRGVSDRTLSYRVVRDIEVTKSSPVQVSESSPLPLYETDTRLSSPPMSQAKATDRDWEVFWERWPKKIRKVEARKAWLAATKHTAAAAIIAGLERLLPSYLANEPRFLPDPVKWLNGERWNDATPEPSKPTGKNTGPRVPVQNEWEYNR